MLVAMLGMRPLMAIALEPAIVMNVPVATVLHSSTTPTPTLTPTPPIRHSCYSFYYCCHDYNYT